MSDGAEQRMAPSAVNAPPELYLCMGSACHQRGVYHLLPILQRLIAEHGLQIAVVLKGAFCLGPCTSGVVMKYRDRVFLDLSPRNIETRFLDEILPYLQAAARGSHEHDA